LKNHNPVKEHSGTTGVTYTSLTSSREAMAALAQIV